MLIYPSPPEISETKETLGVEQPGSVSSNAAGN